MYEEMEEEMPRHYKSLAAHLRTDSPELNHRVSAYIASQTAMATMAKYNEINKMFSEAFPRASSFSQPSQHSHYMSPLVTGHHRSPSLPSIPSVPTTHSTSTQSHASLADNSMPSLSPDETPSAGFLPTPDLSPATTSTDVTELGGTPYQTPQSDLPTLPLDPHPAQQPTSSFTSELPNEVKMMANIDMTDPMAMHFLGDNTTSAFSMPDEYGRGISSFPQLSLGELDSLDCHKPSTDYYEGIFSPIDAPADFNEGPSPTNFTHFGTPGCGGSGMEGWESFVNFDTEQ